MCLNPQQFQGAGKELSPCGKCPACLKRRSAGWSLRLREQEKHSASAFFVTLTYDNMNCPKYYTLVKRDLQLFFKRLRRFHDRYHGSLPIKYFAVGEYGTNGHRPHYHALIFGAHKDSFEAAWTLGEIHIGDVTGASIGYCLKYMMKPQRVPRGRRRIPEFSLMSKDWASLISQNPNLFTIETTRMLFMRLLMATKFHFRAISKKNYSVKKSAKILDSKTYVGYDN